MINTHTHIIPVLCNTIDIFNIAMEPGVNVARRIYAHCHEKPAKPLFPCCVLLSIYYSRT